MILETKNRELHNSFQSVIHKLFTVFNNKNEKILSYVKNDIVIHTKLQTIFNLKFSSKEEQTVHQLILKYALLAEKQSSGGFDLFFEKFFKKINNTHNLEPLQPEDDLSNDKSCVLATAPTTQDIEWLLEKYFDNSQHIVKDMLLSALKYAGFNGKILVEKTNSTPSIELVRGYTFLAKPVWGISNTVLENSQVICIDGYIESVSEIHHLLQSLSESKSKCLLAVRGMSDDVKNTLKVNFDRSTLNLIPVIVQFDIEGINTLKDISIAANVELFSSDKGDLLSSVKLSEISRSKKIIVNNNTIVIVNNDSNKNVNYHVSYLKEKRLEESNEDKISLLDKRIKSLSPNHVIIRIKDDKDFIIKNQQIDYALRAIKSLITHGTIEITNKRLTATEVFVNHYLDKCLHTLNQIEKII